MSPRQTRPHEIRKGDCVESIAFVHGLDPQMLWEHEDNAALREQGIDPHVLPPGEILYVPVKRPKEVDATTERRHRFRRKGVPARLELVLENEDGPRAGLECELAIDGVSRRVVTDADGGISEWISPVARRGLLQVSEYEVYELCLGHLEPAQPDQYAGVRERLDNLGYRTGDNDLTLAAAIELFQWDCGLPETGVADPETCDQLVIVHGS